MLSVERSLSGNMDWISWYISDINLAQNYRQKVSLQNCYIIISQTLLMEFSNAEYINYHTN